MNAMAKLLIAELRTLEITLRVVATGGIGSLVYLLFLRGLELNTEACLIVSLSLGLEQPDQLRGFFWRGRDMR